MTFGEEKEVIYHQFEIDLEDDTRKFLLDYAKKHILEDEDELLNYAIVKILKEQIERETGKEIENDT